MKEAKKLPDGLEEAAEEYNKQVIEETKCHHNALTYAEGYEDALLLIPDAFIAGAEWMVRQGWISVDERQPEMDLEKFTEKTKTFQGRYKHPEIISIKGAMAFMARMFYQYPNVARQWYEKLRKVTMD